MILKEAIVETVLIEIDLNKNIYKNI